MSKILLMAVIGGMTSVILYLSTFLGIPGGLFLAYFSALPLFVVGLSLGLTAGTIATMAAVALTLALTLTLELSKLAVVALFTVVTALPTLLLLRMALSRRQSPEGNSEWCPPGRMVCWLTGYGAVAFVIVAYMAGGGQNGLEETLRENISAALGVLMQDLDPSKAGDMAQMAARYVPAIFMASWLISMVVNAHLAQNILIRLKRNIRPAPPLLDMSLPFGLAGAMLAAAVIWRLAGPGLVGFVSLNLALMMLVPFFLLGLAVVHAVSRAWPSRTPILVTMYLIMVFIGWPVILVAALGLAEQWTGLRQRLAGPGNLEEDE
ncbi:MAG: DUF2232 domain-containing protein [Alphaproteobacteria bacterium]